MQTPKIFRLALCTALALATLAPQAEAQLGKRLQRAAQRGAERALERNAQRKTEEAIDEAFKKPQPQDEQAEVDGEAIGLEESSESGTATQSGGSAPTDANAAPGEAEGPVFSLTSKFDFEPGAKVITYDDFERTSIGDLPSGYNTVGSSEIVNLSTAPGKWLKITSATGQLVAMDFTSFPKNFTLEFDLIHDIPDRGYRYSGEFGTMLTSEADPAAGIDARLARIGKHNVIFWIDRDISRGFHKGFTKYDNGDGSSGKAARIPQHFSEATRGKPQHVSIWRQNKRIRMYINQEKVFDIPLAWNAEEPISGLRFIGQMSESTDSYFLGNVRLAEGAPDTRSKLETEGKLITYGLTFDSGSATLQAASAGTLKRIAEALTANPTMRVRITGHTDGDGDANANQTLSEQRAAAVKQALSTNYGIAANRLETAGKGESSPVADNSTSAGKAQNRRVILEVI